MTDTLKNILDDLCGKNELISVYVDPDDWGRFSVGYVDKVTETHVRLRAISPFGEDAGFEIRPLSEISKIERDGKYEAKIENLRHNRGHVFTEINPDSQSSGNLIEDTLKQSHRDRAVIVLWGHDPDDSLTGYVEALGTEIVSIRLINEFGENDGVATMKLDEITSIDFNTRDEQVRKFLFDAG
ncbi:hypothetical protein [uncultured Sneathiella sp.]|uniref:hypothetical protein n=1 Tax=uncultured Sneathiella sp. TaxID=879315 RepID=UPI0030DBACE4|tara:strand:- start:749 stop:1300 length:552 start_codon:yes stop_codon:yes gene_type:complete